MNKWRNKPWSNKKISDLLITKKCKKTSRRCGFLSMILIRFKKPDFSDAKASGKEVLSILFEKCRTVKKQTPLFGEANSQTYTHPWSHQFYFPRNCHSKVSKYLTTKMFITLFIITKYWKQWSLVIWWTVFIEQLLSAKVLFQVLRSQQGSWWTRSHSHDSQIMVQEVLKWASCDICMGWAIVDLFMQNVYLGTYGISDTLLNLPEEYSYIEG